MLFPVPALAIHLWEKEERWSLEGTAFGSAHGPQRAHVLIRVPMNMLPTMAKELQRRD